jgi:HTH-type transcriptional regulator, sugar sensing transcriptional regulator
MSNPSNNLLVSNLMEFGLSEKEARVYISLLEFEVATVNEVAKASGINRSSAYVVLDSLKQKGLVSFSDDKSVQRYIPSSPNALLKTAEEMAAKQEQIKKNIDAIVPDLKALHKGTKQRPVVRVFEGKEGLINLLEDSLDSKEKLIRTATSGKHIIDIVPPQTFREYMKKRHSRSIKVKGIHPVDGITQKILENQPRMQDEVALIPEGQYNFASNIAIYDNKVAYMSPKHGGIGVLIESKEMADSMKEIFDLAFVTAAKSLHLSSKRKKH